MEDWSHWLPTTGPSRCRPNRCPGRSALYRGDRDEAGWRWHSRASTGRQRLRLFEQHIGDQEAADAWSPRSAAPDGGSAHARVPAQVRRRHSWHATSCRSASPQASRAARIDHIYLTQAAIAQLIDLFPIGRVDDADRAEFNRLVDLEYDRIRDFLILHYHATTRDDSSFWNYVRTMSVPDSLQDKIDLWLRAGRVEKYTQGLFFEPSWLAVFVGQGLVPPVGTSAPVRSNLRPSPRRWAAARTACPDGRVYVPSMANSSPAAARRSGSPS